MISKEGTLWSKLQAAGLVDDVMTRLRGQASLRDVAAWLQEQGIATTFHAVKRIKDKHFDDWLLRKVGVDSIPEETHDINLDTIRRLGVMLNRECRGLSGMAEIARFVPVFEKYHSILMTRKADFRAEEKERRQLAMRVVDLLDNEDRLAKAKQLNNDMRKDGLEARITEIARVVWGDALAPAA